MLRPLMIAAAILVAAQAAGGVAEAHGHHPILTRLAHGLSHGLHRLGHGLHNVTHSHYYHHHYHHHR